MELRIDDLIVEYGSVRALHGITLNVNQGEIVALIGSNGAGKSSTLKAISGLVSPAGGEITLGGTVISDLPAYDVAALGIAQVPEGRHVFPRLTVLENLEMGGYLIDDKVVLKREMEKVFELFPRLFERRTQAAGSLSGGEQQMLALGRALVRSPQFLLLDEPSLGLAPVVVEKIFDIIGGPIRDSGVGVLLVEQNALMALSIASRGYVLETGRIVMEAPAGQLMEDPRVKKAYIGG